MTKSSQGPQSGTQRQQRIPYPPGLQPPPRQPVPQKKKKKATGRPKNSALSCFDVRVSTPVPRPYPDGDSLDLNDKLTDTLAVTSKRRVLFVTNTGRSAHVVTELNLYSTPSITAHACPTMAADNPISACFSRAGIEIVSTGKELDVSGTIFVAQVNSRLEMPAAPAAMTTAQWGTLIDSLITKNGTETYGAAELRRRHTFSCCPVDTTVYNGFQKWENALTTTDIFSTFTTWPDDPDLLAQPLLRGMTTLAIIFEAVPDDTPQTYRYTAHGSWRTRHSAKTILNRLQGAPSVMSPAGIAAEMTKVQDQLYSKSTVISDVANAGAKLLTGVATSLAAGKVKSTMRRYRQELR